MKISDFLKPEMKISDIFKPEINLKQTRNEPKMYRE